eukprot:TRINITY_DN877_c1_g1_i1.p1 TRINITY_DN877_c1_g1~~TRINITY_DN877_c1_g1_i1.p1  ORF type:complete len:1286 (+),score=358.15 TRINITY_DN877_c1_g1_i1:39-3860(+)
MEEIRVEVGCRVLAETKDGGSKIGIAQFVGSTYFAPGTWVGVELESAEGKNDGTVQGRRYFSCQPKHGIFIKIEQCKALARPVQTIPQTPRLRRAEEEGRAQQAAASEATPTSPTAATTTTTDVKSPSAPSSEATSPKKAQPTEPAPVQKAAPSKPPQKEPPASAPSASPKKSAPSTATAPTASPKKSTAATSKARTTTPPPAISVAPAAAKAAATKNEAPPPQSPPKPAMPTLQLNKLPTVPPTGAPAASNASSTLSASVGSMSTAPITPRIAGDDLRILLEQKKSLEVKLKEKSDLLTAEKEKAVKTKDELKAKYDSQRKVDAETMRELKQAIQQKEEQLSEKNLDLEIAEEEKLMLQERLDSFQKGVRESSVLKEIAPDEEGKERQLIELSNAMTQMDIIVGDLTEERDLLKEDVLALRHLRDKCRVLQNKVDDFSERLDEMAEIELQLEETVLEVAALKEEKSSLAAQMEEYRELADLSSELEHAQSMELQKTREDFDSLYFEKSDMERKIGQQMREAAEKALEIENYKRLVSEYKESIRKLDSTLHDTKQQIDIGKERERFALQQSEFSDEMEKLSKSWSEKTQTMKQTLAEEYRNWVLDFLPTNLVDAETPVLDVMASLERTLFNSSHISDASSELLSLHLRQLEGSLSKTEDGFIQVSTGLYKDIAFEEYDMRCTASIVALCMHLFSFIGYRVRTLACRVPDFLLQKNINTCLDDCEVVQNRLINSLFNDTVLSASTVTNDIPQILRNVKSLWETSFPPKEGTEELSKDDTRLRAVEGGTLMFFVLAMVCAAEQLNFHIQSVVRYLNLHEPIEQHKESVETFKTILSQLSKSREEFTYRVKSLYKDFEETEVVILQPIADFDKMRVMLLQLLHCNTSIRNLVVTLHDRASNVKHGTVSQSEGFYSISVIVALQKCLTEPKVNSLSALLSNIRSGVSEDTRIVTHDFRLHVTDPLLRVDENLEKFVVIDDTTPLPEIISDVANISLKVWADLQNQYWGADGQKPVADETDGQQGHSPHVTRALQIRNRLASVGDLMDKIEISEKRVTEEEKKKKRMEEELATALLEVDKLKTIAENVKNASEEIETLKTKLLEEQEQSAEARKSVVRNYTEAIDDLRMQLNTAKDDKEQILGALKKKKHQQTEFANVGEALRLRHALAYSQKRLKEEKYSNVKGRWLAVMGSESGKSNGNSFSSTFEFEDILSHLSELQASIAPKVLSLSVPDLSTSRSCISSMMNTCTSRDLAREQKQRLDKLLDRYNILTRKGSA